MIMHGAYIDDLYQAFLRDPESVSKEWQDFFQHGTYQKNRLKIFADHVQLDPLNIEQPIKFDLHTQTTALETSHIADLEKRFWLEEAWQRKPNILLSDETIYRTLYQSHAFETFLHHKYPGAKRFGIEGCETVVVALEEILHHAAGNKVQDVVFAMAHRGRLCVLANILKQSFPHIFQQFEGYTTSKLADDYGSGDVKYHAGYSTNRRINNHDIHLSLTPNPSHLEAVTPVALGRVRAKQNQHNNIDYALGVVLHGDAAFAGQGVVMESLQLANLNGYHSGGTVHIIINNQIGFTTLPHEARSTSLPTDIARMMGIPVLHVQGNGNIKDALQAVHLLLDYRKHFKSDILINWVGYRRHGHNEGDEPSYTQPVMYKAIENQPKLPIDIPENIKQEVDAELEEAWKSVKSDAVQHEPDWLSGIWRSIRDVRAQIEPVETGIDESMWNQAVKTLSTVPSDFQPHPKLERWINTRHENFISGKHIDWAMAESLAFGSLLQENCHVRLSGQDVARGTFSQRHTTLFDHTHGKPWTPLKKLGNYEVINSPLSEMAVMGFEYGYSTVSPQNLVIWEAQFGDFANGAQIIIDQFLAAGAVKWFRLSGLVLLLPHGFEGQGPEHSSARLERFLQLSAENNWRVANPTTPANYFHVLRLQIKEKGRVPLILMTPKSLLRHKRCVSEWDDFAPGTTFQPVIYDPFVRFESAERIILCQGKIYYELLEQRNLQQAYHISIIRLEQLYPLPNIELPESAELVWCQEEPRNMGAWPFLCTQPSPIWRRCQYVGRPASASPATGYSSRHFAQQQALLKEAIGETA